MVDTKVKGNFELRSYPVGAGDKHRLFKFACIQFKEAAKTANLAQDAAVESLLRKILNALLGTVATADIDPGIGIGYREVRAGFLV